MSKEQHQPKTGSDTIPLTTGPIPTTLTTTPTTLTTSPGSPAASSCAASTAGTGTDLTFTFPGAAPCHMSVVRNKGCGVSSRTYSFIVLGTVMNSMAEARGLQYPLTDTAIVPPSLRTHNRHHDGCPCNVDRSIPISVIGMSAGLADKGGLTLAIGFLAVSTHTTRSGGVGRVHRMQRDTCKSCLVRQEETELEEGPGG